MAQRQARRSTSVCARMYSLAVAVEEAVASGDFFITSWGDREHFKSIKLVRLIRARAPQRYYQLLQHFDCDTIQCLSIKVSIFLTRTLFKTVDGKAMWASDLARALREMYNERC